MLCVLCGVLLLLLCVYKGAGGAPARAAESRGACWAAQ